MIQNRCPWANKNSLLMKYHDQEWGRKDTNEQMLFEQLSLEIFQAGLTWNLILQKRNYFRKAFDNFNVDLIAHYDQNNYENLIEDKNIIRNRAKILATIHNAKVLDEMHQSGKTLCKLTWQPVHNTPIDHMLKPNETPNYSTFIKSYVNDFKKMGFKRVGKRTLYSYLQSVGVVNDHLITCFCHNLV